MTTSFLLWLAMVAVGVQSVPPLSLDVRVFRGATEVTRETTVTVFPAGTRTDGRAAPLSPSGEERRMPLSAGQYDVQLVQQGDGKVNGIAWATLRLLVNYPGEAGRHLEVLNFDKGWGALQVREAAATSSAPGSWSARLLRKDGTEVARGLAGDGYQVLVAPAGTYQLAVVRAATPVHVHEVEVKANLTYVRTF